jgi:hypothetical protein
VEGSERHDSLENSSKVKENGSDRHKRVRRTTVKIARHYTRTWIDVISRTSLRFVNQHMKLNHRLHLLHQESATAGHGPLAGQVIILCYALS